MVHYITIGPSFSMESSPQEDGGQFNEPWGTLNFHPLLGGLAKWVFFKFSTLLGGIKDKVS